MMYNNIGKEVVCMYDTHFDLLTILYVLKDKNHYIKKIKKDINNNLIGMNANLYFMNKKEMEDELGITGDINVSKMFKEAIDIYNSLDIKSNVIFSIEGCDYVKSEEELEYLYSLGLRAILPVWNNENKYGSGNRSQKGLTKDGEKLIKKAIDLNIAIDLSHANENTFFDIIDVIKNYNKKAICYASHSNIRSIQNNSRNLTDKELLALKDVGGYLGLVMHPPFITDDKQKIKDIFLSHIEYASRIMGIDKVMLASDNLEFYDELGIKNENVSPFKYENMKNDIEKLLKKSFNEFEIKKIMYENAMEIYRKISE